MYGQTAARIVPLAFHSGLFMHGYYVFQDKKKPGYMEMLPGLLKQFSNFMGDRKWFAGDKVP